MRFGNIITGKDILKMPLIQLKTSSRLLSKILNTQIWKTNLPLV